MTLTKKAGDNGAGLLTWVQGSAPADNGAGLLTWVQGLAPARTIPHLPLFSIS